MLNTNKIKTIPSFCLKMMYFDIRFNQKCIINYHSENFDSLPKGLLKDYGFLKKDLLKKKDTKADTMKLRQMIRLKWL